MGAGCERHQPQAGASLVGGEVGLALHEHQIASIGRYLGVADALEHHEVLDRERRARLTGVRAAQLRDRKYAEAHGERGPRGVVAMHGLDVRAIQPTSSAAIVHGSCFAAASHSCSAASSSTLAMYQRAVCEMCAP